MALAKCPDCGKMVSDRAISCPFCGCPAEYFSESEEKADSKKQSQILDQESSAGYEEKIVFRFGNQEFTYKKKDSDCIKAIGYYLVMGEMISYIADVAYDQCDGIGDALRRFPDAVESFLEENIFDVTIELLYRMGDSLSIEQFIRKYINKYNIQYESYYTSIVEKYAEIRHEEAKLAEYRRNIRNSRGRWIGGGFGLKGAVKGAITAGMLNCTADFLHSFGDTVDERKDSKEIQRRLKELYKDPQTKRQLVGGMRSCILNIMEAMQDEMVEIGALSSKITISYGKAMTLYNNTLKWEDEEKTLYANIAQCIAYYPVEAVFYQKFEPAIMKYEENDFSSFIEFWGFHDILSQFTNQKDNEVDYDNWKLRFILETYYEKYKIYLPSSRIDLEKKKALEYRKHRDEKSVQFADNIKRRLCSLIENATVTVPVINMPLYLLRPEFKPDVLKADTGIDQYVFWDNGESVITDYAIIINSKTVVLEQINEIWYGRANEKRHFPIRFMLKNNQGIINTESVVDSTIDIITLLNIALEPYRELEYMTEFDSEILDMYITLRNNEKIQAIDNEDDRRKKKILENNLKRKRKVEVEQQSVKNRTEEERKISASIRRRFQMLLEVENVEDAHVVNKYIYELEAESKIIPKLVREYEIQSDEFLFYANDIYAITDYTLCIVGKNKERFTIRLQDINQIYLISYKTICIALKINGKSRKPQGISGKNIEIRYDWDYEYFREEILYFLNIALEPYREDDFIPKVSDAIFHPYDFLRKFEEKRGNFGEFIRNDLDDDFDKEKKRLINVKAKERMEIRKKVADSYTQGHLNTIIDKFAIDFRRLFTYLYEMEENMQNSVKDIKYFNEFLNHYDYEIYECMPEESRKYLDQMEEKGQYILWAKNDVVLTDRKIYIGGHAFSLYDIKEILDGGTIQADEADSYEDWIDSDIRYLVVFKNETIQELRFSDVSIGLRKVWHPLNYTLKTLHNCVSPYKFLKEEFFFCECCNSFNIIVSEGLLGKKYRCANCGNKSKRKLIIGYNDKNCIDQKVVEKFVSQNNMDLKYENRTHKEERTMTLCEHCGKQISPNIKFCNFCGHPVKPTPINQQKKFCVYCGKEILREVKFCNFCGKSNSTN